MSIILPFLVTIKMVINMNKKNRTVIVIISCILVGLGIFIYFYNRNSSNNSKYEASKTSTNSTENTSENNVSGENNSNSTTNTTPIAENNTNNEVNIGIHETKPPAVTEEKLATFTTKIYSKDSARQNNISITCNKLNGTIVKDGATFSFCNTVGQASSSKGYQKADIYDKDGKKKKGLGGGNCQISSTLYNALLAVPSLVVTERHEHSNKVPYVAKGKDAAVAYGSYDLKFRNNSGNDVKILSSSNSSDVTVTLMSLK